jgi:hypothetical protein
VPGPIGEARSNPEAVPTAPSRLVVLTGTSIGSRFKAEQQRAILGEAEYEGVLIEANLAEELPGRETSPE